MLIKVVRKNLWLDNNEYQVGEVVEVSKNVGFGLVEAGRAINLLEMGKPKAVEKAPANKQITRKRRGRKPKVK